MKTEASFYRFVAIIQTMPPTDMMHLRSINESQQKTTLARPARSHFWLSEKGRSLSIGGCTFGVENGEVTVFIAGG